MDVKVCFWRRSIQGTPRARRVRALPRACPGASFGDAHRTASSPTRRFYPPPTTRRVCTWSVPRCGAATMFSKPFVSTRARHKNSRRRKSKRQPPPSWTRRRGCAVAKLRDPEIRDALDHGQAFHERSVLVRPEHLQRAPRVGARVRRRRRVQAQLPLGRVEDDGSPQHEAVLLVPTPGISRTRSPVSRSSSTSFEGPRLCGSAPPSVGSQVARGRQRDVP